MSTSLANTTSPAVTVKLSSENEAIPLLDELASSPLIVIV
jgi:hypothetical protein